ncbi:hypothetical protein M514_19186, partial [Trichuris suis]
PRSRRCSPSDLSAQHIHAYRPPKETFEHCSTMAHNYVDMNMAERYVSTPTPTGANLYAHLTALQHFPSSISSFTAEPRLSQPTVTGDGVRIIE